MINFYTQENLDGKQIVMERDEVISFVPNDEANSDYQRYLRWLENPDADEVPTL